MASDAGNLRINVTAQIAGLKDGMLKATATVNKFKRDAGKGMESVKSAIFSVTGAVLALAGVGGIGALIKSGADYADSLLKTANKLGDTTEGIQAMHHAMGLAGLEVEQGDKLVQKWTKTISEAAQGTSSASSELQELGLSAQSLARMTPTQSLETLTTALNGVELQSDKVRIATVLFGKEGADMITVLASGNNVFKDAAAEIAALGISIDSVEAKKIENANDALSRVGAVVKGIGEKFAALLAPWIEYVANKFLQWVKDAGGAESIVAKSMDGIRTSIGWVITAVDYLVIGWETLRLGVLTFASITLGALDKVGRAAHWLANLVGEDTPYAWEGLTAVVGGFEQAMIGSQARLINLVGAVGQNADATKIKLDAITAAADAVASSQVSQQATQEVNPEQVNTDFLLEQVRIRNDARREERDLTIRIGEELAAAEAAQNQAKIDAVKSTFEVGATLMSAQSKKLFKIGKASAIASALINTYEAVTKTMANVPYPFNIPLAIAQGVAGMVQVQNIKSQQFSGAREFGGPVVKGRSYLVGETGEEVFTPNQSGSITANKDIGGGSNKNVTLNISTLDTKSMADMFKNNRQMLYNTVLEAMNEDGRRFA